MDVFQLLEAIRPQDKVITVQVSSPKDYLAYLFTLAPSVVAILALIFSAWQFKATIKNQLRLAQINAKLSTDIEIKKEWCREVRRLCTECLVNGNNSHAAKQHGQWLKEKHENGGALESDKILEYAHEQQIHFYEMMASYYLLVMFLEPVEYAEFIKLLESYTELVTDVESTSHTVGFASGLIVGECRKILSVKNKDISQIVDEIS